MLVCGEKKGDLWEILVSTTWITILKNMREKLGYVVMNQTWSNHIKWIHIWEGNFWINNVKGKKQCWERINCWVRRNQRLPEPCKAPKVVQWKSIGKSGHEYLSSLWVVKHQLLRELLLLSWKKWLYVLKVLH